MPSTSGPDDAPPADELVAVFSALGDATRLAIVRDLLRNQPESVSRIASRSSLTRQAVSKHLRVLELAGVVSRARVGRESRYRVEPGAFDAARQYLERASTQWDDALARLSDHLG